MDERKRMSASETSAFISAQRRMTFAGVDEHGHPFARVFDVATHEGQLLFHGAERGEKMALLGREVVAEAHEVVAEIPSYFTDAQRACPATTFYRSVHVRGRVQVVDSIRVKAALLQQLMQQRQADGSYRPIDPDAEYFERLYAKTLRKILVARVDLGESVGRYELGQNKSISAVAKILEGLWRRGDSGDVQAIVAVLAAHRARVQPGFMQGPHGLELRVHQDAELTKQAAGLLEGVYWRLGTSAERLAEIQAAATAWVGWATPEGELVATARAVSDGCDYAYIGDVVVAPPWRGRGVGRALTKMLLDHPRVRGARHKFLVTEDAQSLYADFDFEDVGRLNSRTLMRATSTAVAARG